MQAFLSLFDKILSLGIILLAMYTFLAIPFGWPPVSNTETMVQLTFGYVLLTYDRAKDKSS